MRHAALGAAVVPEVNWTLMISFGRRGCLGNGLSDPPSRRMWSKLIAGLRSYPFLCPLELFTTIIRLRVGTAKDSTLEAKGSVKISRRIEMVG